MISGFTAHVLVDDRGANAQVFIQPDGPNVFHFPSIKEAAHVVRPRQQPARRAVLNLGRCDPPSPRRIQTVELVVIQVHAALLLDHLLGDDPVHLAKRGADLDLVIGRAASFAVSLDARGFCSVLHDDSPLSATPLTRL
jgi:hypothetical protein